MFLSRVTLDLTRLPPAMLDKWFSEQQAYACHQWLWQLFPDEPERRYLFRQESSASQGMFYLLSEKRPQQQHNLFQIATKPYEPLLEAGMTLFFNLRANPVVTRQGKRSDVMMDAKFHARRQGLPSSEWRMLKEQAAQRWLQAQGGRHGFRLSPLMEGGSHVIAFQSQRLSRRNGEKPITFSTVDYAGYLTVTEPTLFLQALRLGLGKSKALGCGLLMIKRAAGCAVTLS
ncbi:type I-E CRISPR-associated protein Cas6/Cse3/CasE [Serratia ureilytica]|uniref:type I-E CRISPR-associated protein Cas6/Cse3/CasE n=1 Tax=Serratia ureilytica TaxID=300181 RepID=UPI001D180E01|nr:type I-E CRISPR-associated protein Cas6/Cse3/CasE [Serratia ureilytica]MCC4106767.1 type I-E CRISPR-associated protein Cas6/Cse3/CasE [Serratia ureilytica]